MLYEVITDYHLFAALDLESRVDSGQKPLGAGFLVTGVITSYSIHYTKLYDKLSFNAAIKETATNFCLQTTDQRNNFV